MIKNIVFDIGNVLLNFKPVEYLRTKMEEENIKSVKEAVFDSPEWPMLDEGTITEKEAIRVISERNAEIKDLVELAFDNWYDMLTPIENSVKLLKELKAKGYNLYYLSNFQELAYDYIIKEYEFFGLFDGGVASFAEKLMKPDKDIYEKLMERYDLKPEECLFMDDTALNIDGAENVGMKGIVFTTAEDAMDKLKKFDVLV
ncbi:MULTISPECIES: HAD family hydrolase [Clostridium]|uniref:HAD family phosphatase n=1 Tax=Clostridium cadaveris TaxID=1529 RepID=A0A1I2NVR6_9CLOT|nr:HAD family phosphatase [Clostridium cadaveris]MDU4951813.1 HAD family phosphatase [Clostridium sp.]MDM8312043.1 HAD family phosphatase [Clostridium cadaveris]MDY4950251.1 HAD family phosphatase [Clostridium cadaveris]NME64824.1 HAD family phosphatase [Clostridium cadaveris]NWK12202.1 HAD family phosphatase [Clostridium cadaveris]